LNIITTSNPDDKELMPAKYTTETKWEHRIQAAALAGERKYSIVKHDNHTELAYILELCETSSPTQREFEIEESSYIISVKNPDIQVPGSLKTSWLDLFLFYPPSQPYRYFSILIQPKRTK